MNALPDSFLKSITEFVSINCLGFSEPYCPILLLLFKNSLGQRIINALLALVLHTFIIPITLYIPRIPSLNAANKKSMPTFHVIRLLSRKIRIHCFQSSYAPGRTNLKMFLSPPTQFERQLIRLYVAFSCFGFAKILPMLCLILLPLWFGHCPRRCTPFFTVAPAVVVNMQKATSTAPL